MNYKTFNVNDYIAAKPLPTNCDLFPDQFCILYVGGPGSGKTTLIEIVLNEPRAHYKKFDLVLFISPSEIPFVEANGANDRYHSSLDYDWIVQKIEYEKSLRKVENCLLILDDVVSTVNKSSNNAEVQELFFNRRKLVKGVCVSIIATTQKFTLFPAKFRSSLSGLVVFKVPNDDFKVIISQQTYHAPETIRHVARSHFNKAPNNFLYILLNPYKLFLNFEKQV